MVRTLWRKFISPDTDEGTELLQALLHGETLKSHRDLDGNKQYLRHHLDGTTRPVDPNTVNQLCRQGFIGSNQKFPSATYILTERGRQRAELSTSVTERPITARLR